MTQERYQEAAEAPLPTKDDLMQSVYALERAEQDLRRLAERLMNQRDYSAEFPAADADSIARLLPLLHAIARGDLVVCEPVLHVCDDTHGDPVATGVEYRPATSIPGEK